MLARGQNRCHDTAMSYLNNRFFGVGLAAGAVTLAGEVRSDAKLVLSLLAKCPASGVTPLVNVPELATNLRLNSLIIKDERGRMRLGSFKALGAAFAIAKSAYSVLGDDLFQPGSAQTALCGTTFVAATAGNHGLSVAAGARIFGARAIIYIAQTVPDSFAQRLRSLGADVVRQGAIYEDSLAAAMHASEKNDWQLLSDTSWPGYTGQPLDVMEGYLAMASEMVDQAETANILPSHVFLQAGVGGLAAAIAAHLRRRWGQDFQIVVVEPEAAPALQASISAGRPVVTTGPVSNMGRLDCKEPSHLALGSLAKTANGFLTVTDNEVADAIRDLSEHDLGTSPSGGAGYAGLKKLRATGYPGLTAKSRAVVVLSEGVADA